MPKLALTGGAYQARSVIASAQRCLNLFAEPMPQGQGEPAQFAYYPTPGLVHLGTLPENRVRGIRQVTTGAIYAVAGSGVYKVDPTSWTGTHLGDITAGLHTPVSMSDNGNTLVVVDGTVNGWTVDLASDAFAAISDTAFYGGTRVEFLDTFFLFNKPNTPQFYWSGSLATTFDPEDFINKEGFSDLLVTIAVAKLEIWLLGTRTTEIYYNAGQQSIADVQFQRQGGVFVDHGCLAPYSVATYDDAVYWIGCNRAGQGIVLAGQNYQTRRISSYAIEAHLATLAKIDDAVGFTYLLGGHAYYVLALPAADETWVYDITTGQWHEWRWLDTDGVEHRHRAHCCAYVNGEVVVGDWQYGHLYRVDPAVYTDDGRPIKRQRSFPHIVNEMDRVFYRQFVADIESGNPGAGVAITTPEPPGGFTVLPLITDGVRGGSYAVSADGNTVVGFINPVPGDNTSSHSAACYWSSPTDAPTVIGPDFSEAYGVSGDGSVIVGDTFTNPFIWTAATGYVLFGGSADAVWAISADGTRLVGAASVAGSFEACYWNRSFARTDLGFLPGHDSSTALGVSRDGTYIVGYSQQSSVANSQRAFRWSASGGMIDLGVAGGALGSSATGVSDNGTVVSVNQSGGPSTAGAAKWTSSGGLVLLPSLSGIVSSNFATGASGDGSTIIGTSDAVVGGVGQNTENLAWWTSDGITVMPQDLLTVGLVDAKGVSGDGRVIVGTTHGSHHLPWVYRRGAPAPVVTVIPPTSQVFLDWSDDRGHSFGNMVGQPIGARGAYLTSVQYQRLGMARDRVFRLTWSVPVKTALQGAFVEADTTAKS